MMTEPSAPWDIPTEGLATYQSNKIVRAGVIIEVVPAGCYVQDVNPDDAVLRIFQPNMTVRYQPQVGDYWLVYPDGYQAISPKAAFESGYTRIAAT
jgi:hypothetical protein